MNRAMQAIAINFMPEFLAVLKREVQNLELCVLYPCAIVEVIANLVKTQLDWFQTHLHVLVEVTLKTLETNNAALRRQFHRYVTHALHVIVKNYPNVAFNQQNQVFFAFWRALKI